VSLKKYKSQGKAVEVTVSKQAISADITKNSPVGKIMQN
jgi:hypothetical protein